jgi:hypothetical protein
MRTISQIVMLVGEDQGEEAVQKGLPRTPAIIYALTDDGYVFGVPISVAEDRARLALFKCSLAIHSLCHHIQDSVPPELRRTADLHDDVRDIRLFTPEEFFAEVSARKKDGWFEGQKLEGGRVAHWNEIGKPAPVEFGYNFRKEEINDIGFGRR